ncbi:hypothetical protein AB0C18_13240 [Nonomuraea muscovyensis]|uniref:hypothetical protein n=1 Tax=Nonomuraea muscovyensis TaxID=1124761 RepID=UPI0034009B91|nr:hypothetical protein [Nonomuraea muscovyensis]
MWRLSVRPAQPLVLPQLQLDVPQVLLVLVLELQQLLVLQLELQMPARSSDASVMSLISNVSVSSPLSSLLSVFIAVPSSPCSFRHRVERDVSRSTISTRATA